MDDFDFSSAFGNDAGCDERQRGYGRHHSLSTTEEGFLTPHGSDEDLREVGSSKDSAAQLGKYSGKVETKKDLLSPFRTLNVPSLSNDNDRSQGITRPINRSPGVNILFGNSKGDYDRKQPKKEAASLSDDAQFCTPQDDYMKDPRVHQMGHSASNDIYAFSTPNSSLPSSRTDTPLSIQFGTPQSFHSLNPNNPSRDSPVYFTKSSDTIPTSTITKVNVNGHNDDVYVRVPIPSPLPSLAAPVQNNVGGSSSAGGEEEGGGEVEVNTEEAFSFMRMTRVQKIIFVIMSLSNFASYLCLSVPGPFFPEEAKKKGLNNTQSGWVFAVFSLTQFLVSPVCGKLLPVVGSRFMFLSGTFLGGGCVIIFGMLDKINFNDGGMMFLAFCLVTRIFMSIGCTAATTAAFAICINSFPNAVATVLGVLETFTGLGMMLGPAIGGVLYEAGGYMLPFLVLGIVMVITVPITFVLLPKHEDKDQSSNGSMWQLLKSPSGLVICLTIMMSAIVWAALDPTLQPHLEDFDLSADIIGLVFLLSSAFYAITSPIWGKIADKMYDSKPLVIVGLLITGLCCLLLGPSPILGFPKDYHELWLDLVSVSVMGLSVSMSVVPTFDLMMWVAEDAGLDESIGTYGLVAGLWTAAYALG
ncbi:MFS-type transporter SLC18B1-like isoform X2 [Lingula anatina]|nr:MFS-type transporter SLC18B1-like isoform X2 [Lingula anatina]|eukprot:XP_013381873.1 MFS-type transporter SLC18B1-like isoform X2 [Lingula anatina]